MEQLCPTNWLSRILAITGVLTLMFVAVLGVGMGMNMRSNGSMAGCLFMNHPGALCPMNALEHVARWQKIFSAIPALRLLYISLFALQLLYILSSSLLTNFKPDLKRTLHALVKDNKLLIFFDYLILAFSRGILNPKIYESAAV